MLQVVASGLVPGRGEQVLAERHLRDRRRVSLRAVADTGPFAEFDAAAAHGFGIAGDVHTTDDRSLTQAWAAAVERCDHVGVRGHARTPPAGTAGTWTLFGPAGPAERPPPRLATLALSRAGALEADRQLLAALAAHGVHVLPVPDDVDAD